MPSEHIQVPSSSNSSPLYLISSPHSLHSNPKSKLHSHSVTSPSPLRRSFCARDVGNGVSTGFISPVPSITMDSSMIPVIKPIAKRAHALLQPCSVGTSPQHYGTLNSSNLTAMIAKAHSGSLPSDSYQESHLSLKDHLLDVNSTVKDTLGDSFGSVSHQLLGGEVTRDIYLWNEKREAPRRRNSEPELPSLSSARGVSGDDTAQGTRSPDLSSLRASDLRVPGMFRRTYIHAQAEKQGRPAPNFLTGSFIDFLVLYGFFGGDVVPEETSDDETCISDTESLAERAPLLATSASRPCSIHTPVHGISTKKAFFMLIKAFVGTGVLFLPKAFLNGGMGFSLILMVLVGFLSLHCMLLLVETSRGLGGMSFGDVGAQLYGPSMRQLILTSIAVAQIGFCCAYYIFVGQNLKDLTMILSECRWVLPDWYFILLQMVIYIPLCWIRRIKHFSITSLIADVFIFMGLAYILYYDIYLLSIRGPARDIVWFNFDSFPLFIGTAIFAFEGICLILPIADSMKEPEKFGWTLTACIVTIGTMFVIVGAVGYLTFGSHVATIVFLNLPKQSPTVLSLQFLYGLAIMLSFPLNIYPAIRITESALFGLSTGKLSNSVKWQKNVYRGALILFTAAVAFFGSENLDKFVSLVGCFACIPLAFIYPALFHSKIATSWTIRMKDWGLVMLGSIAFVYTTWITAQQILSGRKDVPIDRCAP